jgi:hypothetical protein
MGFFRKLEDDIKDLGRKIDDEIIQPIKENPEVALGVALMFVPGLQGVGASLGSAIAPAANAAVQAGIGNAIIQGALTEAQGGDFLEGAALSGLGSVAGGFIQPGLSEALGGGVTGNIASNALIGGGMSELSGGDFATGALISGIGSGINQAANKLKSFSAYTPNADGTFTYQWDDGSQITIDNQANVLGYVPSGEFVNAPIASQQAQQDIQNKLGVLNVAKTLTPYAVTALLAKNAYDTATQDDQGNYQYSVVPIPTDWRSPEYNMAFTPSEAIDFGSPEMLAGTQWSQPTVAMAQQPMDVSTLINSLNLQQTEQLPQFGMDQIVGNINDVPMSINDIISNLGQNAMQPFDMNQNFGELNNAPASLNSIIAGIQSQYG